MEDTPSARYEALVREYGGTRVIRRVLIANNGMAATKFILSVRRWLHLTCGDSSLIKLIGMATPDDIKASAKHVSLANVIEEVPAGSNANNYANVNLIISLAIKHNADAIWPGWGHASENPALPRAAMEAGIAFIGPDEHAMFMLGDKVASTIIAQTARVPCVAWSGSGLVLDVDARAEDGCAFDERLLVPDETFQSACVHSAEEALEVAERVGYPIMIKASEGGGGKGVRKALGPETIPQMYRQVADEVRGSPIFLMRLCQRARHIEIQLLCDSHGNVSVLSGRDCSMQRRFQKIVEEGPPRCVPPRTMASMERAGQRLASLVGYQSAGTVEFLYVEESDEFFFLELNPRLQVEHPVTEGVTGLNLPSLQLLAAMGCDLRRMPRVAEFIVDRSTAGSEGGADPDPDYDPFAKVAGRHVVAARITAENTADGWKPTVGAIAAINFQPQPDVWGYFSVDGTTAAVHQFADSQFGHVFATAPTRAEAIQAMLLGLDGLSVRGEVRTNVLLLKELVSSAQFRANRVDTAWLDGVIAADQQPVAGPSEETVAICGALMKAWQQIEATCERICHEFIDRAAQPPEPLVQSLVELRVDFVCNRVQYALEVYRHAPTIFSVAANGSLVQAKLYPMASDGAFLVTYGDTKRTVSVQDEPGGALRLTIDGHVVVVEKEKDPSVLPTAYTGKLTRFLVEDGAHVDKGAAYAEIEVMKMLCMLNAPEAGTISVERPAGSFVESGEVIATMRLDNPSLVERPTPFARSLGEYAPIIDDGSSTFGGSLSYALGVLQARLECIFDGYLDNEEEVIIQLHEVLNDPSLLQRELLDTLRRCAAQLPKVLVEQIGALTSGAPPSSPPTPPGAQLQPRAADLGARVLQLVHSHRAALEARGSAHGSHTKHKHAGDAAAEAAVVAEELEAELAEFDAHVAPIAEFGKTYARGMRARTAALVEHFVSRFLRVEELYSSTHTMAALLAAADNEPTKLVQTFLAHSQLERRRATLMSLIDLSTSHTAADGASVRDDGADGGDTRIHFLRGLAALEGLPYAKLQSKAKQLLGSMTDDMAAHMTKQLYPSLQSLAAGTLSDDDERAFTRSLRAHMHVAQALLFKAYAESTSVLRKAVARTLVHLWYGHTDVSSVQTKTYFRHGKEKSVVTWEYDAPPAGAGAPNGHGGGGGGGGGARSVPPSPLAPGGAARDRESGVLVFFSTREDMEAHFAWLCTCISGVEPSKARAKASASTSSMTRTLSSKALNKSPSAAEVALAAQGSFSAGGGPKRTVHVVIMADIAAEHKWKLVRRGAAASASYDSFDDSGSAKYFQEFTRAHAASLRALDAGVCSVTIPTPTRDAADVEALMSMVVTPTYSYTLPDFEEVSLWRHILPQFVPWLELERLSSFEIKHEQLPTHPLIHVFVGTAKQQAQDRRLFVRAASLADTQAARAATAGRPRGGSIGGGGGGGGGSGGGGAQAVGAAEQRGSSASLFEETPPPLSPGLAAIEASADGGGASDERAAIGALKSLLESVHPSLTAAKAAHYSSVHVFLHHRQPLALALEPAVATLNKALRHELALPDNSMLELEVRLAHTELMAPLALGARGGALGGGPHLAPPGGGGGGGGGAASALRVLARWSHMLQISVYQEITQRDADGADTPATLSHLASEPKTGAPALEGASACAPYRLLSVIDQRRMRCHKLGTTYAYDLLELFSTAVRQQWDDALKRGQAKPADVPARLTSATELVLTRSGALQPLPAPREGGENSIGMLAWRMTMCTPEYPAGRDVILIANDVSVQNGTFGPKEDEVFKQASALARAHKLPRVYIAANSGARFGLSETVKQRFRVEWVDWDDPNKGVKYLYLTPKDKEALGDAVVTQEVRVRVHKARRAFQLGDRGFESDDDGAAEAAEEVQHKILAIIGSEEGLGVECLQGSGMIAAETALANREIFTIALSTSRNIGIGSYVLRLGQRIVQHRTAPIILTGHSALNKLLGNNVYESNLQLGGPEVMANNGISHAVVDSDLEGVASIVKWLGYVPCTAHAPPACLPITDPVDRPITFAPTEGELYDPRCLLRGDADTLGLFDAGSFTESLADWARTVVVGRARLGGMPVGVIATENRLVMKTVLADPANMNSREEQVAQAGQVWFPDSAYKTAQAIHDFNHGERLPLILLANWRGFSGGRKDMFEEVLKFGSYIVENLTTYEQPVIVYIPPGAEVRGGAWVVIDPMINPRVMEMYADPSARGGVLEPAGIAEIKFRRPEVVKAMHRLDPQLQWMRMNTAPSVISKEDISGYEAELMPAYAPLGEVFADLHDRPERMLAKGVIRKVVPWRDARRHFYWRLRRRMAELPLQRRVEARAPTLAHKEVAALVARTLVDGASLSSGDLDDDERVCACLDSLADSELLTSTLDELVDERRAGGDE